MTTDPGQDTLHNPLGLAIREIREQRGWSLEEIADRADLSPTYARGIEDGARSPSWPVVSSLLAQLECPVGEFGRVYDRLASS